MIDDELFNVCSGMLKVNKHIQTASRKSEWAQHLHSTLLNSIKSKLDKVDHNLRQRLDTALWKFLSESNVCAGQVAKVNIVEYVSYELIPTRNQRRKKRRYAEFVDSTGKKHVMRQTTNTPAEFVDFCNRQLGATNAQLSINLMVQPVPYVYTVTVEAKLSKKQS